MSRFAKILKQFESPLDAYSIGRSVRHRTTPDLNNAFVKSSIDENIARYAGNFRNHEVYNTYLRFGRDKALESATEMRAFQDNPILKDYYDFGLSNPHSLTSSGLGEKERLKAQALNEIEKIASKDIYAIQEALRSMPENMRHDEEFEVPLRRSLSFSSENKKTEFLNSVLKGEWVNPQTGMVYWKDPGFHSVTESPYILKRHTGSNPVIIDYRFDGLNTQHPRLTFNFGESESIFLPDTYFAVLRNWKEQNDAGVIDRLELAPIRGNPRKNQITKSLSPNQYKDRMITEKQKAQKEYDKYYSLFEKALEDYLSVD